MKSNTRFWCEPHELREWAESDLAPMPRLYDRPSSTTCIGVRIQIEACPISTKATHKKNQAVKTH